MRREVSASALLALAVALISLGIDLIKQSQIPFGALMVVCGVLLMLITILLVEKGIISAVARQLHK